MELKLIKENADGSADYAFDLTKEEQNNIIRWAIMQAIMKAVEEGNKYDPGEVSMGNSASGGESSVHGSGEQSSKSGQPGDGFKTSQVLG